MKELIALSKQRTKIVIEIKQLEKSLQHKKKLKHYVESDKLKRLNTQLIAIDREIRLLKRGA